MRRNLLTLAFALLIATGLAAQGRFQRGWRREPTRFATADSFDGGLEMVLRTNTS